MQLNQAKDIAERIVANLAPHCVRIDIGGSIRRETAVVKDIEIICSPKMTTPARRSASWCSEVLKIGRNMKGLSGRGTLNTAKYMKFYIQEHNINVDVFVANPLNYGMTLFIRTGSAEFVHKAFTAFNKKGYKSINGVHTNEAGKKLYFTEEEEIFEFLEAQYYPPQKRNL